MLLDFEASAAVVPQAQQRRQHKREDLCFRVRFGLLRDQDAFNVLDQIQAAGPTPDGTEVAYMQNISNGGLGLCGELAVLRGHRLKEGDFLSLEIHPPRTAATLRCVGSVAWVELAPSAGIFRAGVSFVAVNPQDLARMQPGAAPA